MEHFAWCAAVRQCLRVRSKNGWRKGARGRPRHVGAQLCQRVASAVERRRLPPRESAVRVCVRVRVRVHATSTRRA